MTFNEVSISFIILYDIILKSSDTWRIVIPNALPKLLAVAAIVWDSAVVVLTAVVAGTVDRRNAIGSMKTRFEPVGTRTDGRALSRLLIAHCIVWGVRSLRALELMLRRSSCWSLKENSSD